jgi:hypothetical protein
LSSQSLGKASALFPLIEESGYNLSLQASGFAFLCIDHNPKAYRQFIQSGGSPSRAILLRLEPRSVFPSQYQKRVEEKYSLVFSPGMVSPEQGITPEFGWPYQYNSNPRVPSKDTPALETILEGMRINPLDEKLRLNHWLQRPICLSLIAGNWVSPVNENNYDLRRRIAHRIPTGMIEIYGPLWDNHILPKLVHRLKVGFFALRNLISPNLKSIYGGLHLKFAAAKGIVRDKHEVLRASKFTLVTENSNTYSSEKLFDALVDGAIPFYLGPKLSDVGIPSELAFEGIKSSEEIVQIIEGLSDDQILEKLKVAREFLLGEYFLEKWTEKGVYIGIRNRIIEFLDSPIIDT